MLPPDELHHAIRVMRLQSGDPVVVTDGEGAVAAGSLDARSSNEPALVRIAEVRHHDLAHPEIAVYQGAPKGAKADEVVLRLAELGVRHLFVFHSQRAVKHLDGPRRERAVERWNALARSAGKQARRAHFLQVGPVLGWDEVLKRLRGEERSVLLWERASARLRAAIEAPARRIALVVGPEGGFSETEAAAAGGAGAVAAGLGAGILRTEHAASVAAALVLYQHGVIG